MNIEKIILKYKKQRLVYSFIDNAISLHEKKKYLNCFFKQKYKNVLLSALGQCMKYKKNLEI